MRIIGGQARGRTLRAPKGRATRPTSDRVREALFSVLVSRLGGLEGLRVLDLFAGSGALGLEALSRGAEAAVFVDHDRACAKVIRANAELLQLTDRCEVLAVRVAVGLQRIQASGQGFDLVLADPPYALDPAPLLDSLARSELLLPGALLVLEHPSKSAPPQVSGRLARDAVKRYGDTGLSFYHLEQL